jgi:hypothetical protein
LIPSVFASGSEFVVVFIYLVKIPNRVFWLHRGIISDAFNISLKFRMKVSNLDFIIHHDEAKRPYLEFLPNR